VFTNPDSEASHVDPGKNRRGRKSGGFNRAMVALEEEAGQEDGSGDSDGERGGARVSATAERVVGVQNRLMPTWSLRAEFRRLACFDLSSTFLPSLSFTPLWRESSLLA
jgi:hypothetical protein